MRDLIFEKVNIVPVGEVVTAESVSLIIASYKERVENSDDLVEILCSLLDESFYHELSNNIHYKSQIKVFFRQYKETLLEIKEQNKINMEPLKQYKK